MSVIYRIYQSTIELFACVQLRKKVSKKEELEELLPKWLTENYLKYPEAVRAKGIANHVPTTV
jgi:hypothetical protein